MTKHDQLRSLAILCRSLGGGLAIVSQDQYDHLFYDPHCDHDRDPEGVTESPFTSAHGIHWKRKIIYAVEGREEIGSIIHEMGHVFADRHHPYSNKCSEFEWFGWEVAVARQIGPYRVWSRQNGDYATDERGGAEWSSLSTPERRALVLARLGHAQKIGVLGPDGAPRSLRGVAP